MNCTLGGAKNVGEFLLGKASLFSGVTDEGAHASGKEFYHGPTISHMGYEPQPQRRARGGEGTAHGGWQVV